MSGALQTVKQLPGQFSNEAEPISNNFVKRGGEINQSMHSMDRSAMYAGADQDSNASASFLAFNDHKFSGRLLEEASDG